MALSRPLVVSGLRASCRVLFPRPFSNAGARMMASLPTEDGRGLRQHARSQRVVDHEVKLGLGARGKGVGSTNTSDMADYTGTLPDGIKLLTLPAETPWIQQACILTYKGTSIPIVLANMDVVRKKGIALDHVDLADAAWDALAQSNKTSDLGNLVDLVVAQDPVIIEQLFATGFPGEVAKHFPDFATLVDDVVVSRFANTGSSIGALEQVEHKTKNLTDIVKRANFIEYTLGLINRFLYCKEISLGDRVLDLASVTAVARYRTGPEPRVPVVLSSTPEVKAKVDKSVKWMKDALDKGADFYGVTTGFGGAADVRTRQVHELQRELIRHLNAGFGDTLAPEDVRAAMLVRAASNIQGYSALRWKVLENLAALLNHGVTPVIPKRGSISASGDLVPLSYIAATLLGLPHASATIDLPVESTLRGQMPKDYVSAYQDQQTLSPNAPPTFLSQPERIRVGAQEGLRRAGIEPIVLQPKEGLAIVNGTSVCSAAAALSLFDANVAVLLQQALSAMFVEVMLGTNQTFCQVTHDLKPHPGQKEVAQTMRTLLHGSKLCRDEMDGKEVIEDGRIRQDRYAVRTIPQWLGPQLDVLLSASEMITTEINSVTDNPFVDADGDRCIHGGNFQATAVTTAMDSVRISLAAVGKLIFAQFAELVNRDYNNGLPQNLCGSNPNLDMGIQGCEIAMASYQSELQWIANPVGTHVLSAEKHNQDVNSLGLIAARQTSEAVKILQMMLATQLYGLCQAVDLRNIEAHLADASEEVVGRVIESIIRKSVSELVKPDIVDDAVAAARNDLGKCIRAVPPFTYLYSSKEGYRPIYDKALAPRLEDMLRNPGQIELIQGKPLPMRETFAHAAFLQDFRARMACELDEALAVAQRKALLAGASGLMGDTRKLYNFVRNRMNVRYNIGITEPGPAVQQIYDCIRDKSLAPALMETMLGAIDGKQ